MFAEFSVQNFRSIKEKQTFSLVASKDKSLREENTFPVGKNRLLKTAVLYGANASGKSNLFRALSFFLKFATSSFRQEIGAKIKTEPFLFDTQAREEDSEFECIFFIDGKRYRYGFGVNSKRISYEYLFSIPKVQEVYLFTRRLQDIKVNPTYFKEGASRKQFSRENSTFLSVCAQNNGPESTKVVTWLKNLRIVAGFYHHRKMPQDLIEDEQNKAKLIDFLKYADIQVVDMKTEKESFDLSALPESKLKHTLEEKIEKGELRRVLFGHSVYEEGLEKGICFIDGDEESTGTQKLLEYAGPMFRALELGLPFFVDEFDTMLHPLIVESLFRLFQSEKTNPKNAQLIVSSHAVCVLTNKLFRRDQVWFCEKDRTGASEFYSLAEYHEHVRKDASFGKNYLQGKYGAIPFLPQVCLHMGAE